MKCTITLTPSEWVDINNILIEQAVRASCDAANPDFACIKASNEHKVTRAIELHGILRDRMLLIEEDEHEAR